MELRLDRLTKQYKQKLAVDRIDLELKCGVYGLLGANGAGKTTLMRMICDIQEPTSGEIFCNGQNIREMGEEYRDRLGYLPQNFGYYPEFTAYKFLLYIASLKGLGKEQAAVRAQYLLEMVGLADQKKQKIKTFSGGMKQRLGIAQAMLNEPEILILDEPTAGLDPKERVRFRNLISSFSKDKIVLLSTHIVSDVEYIADEILVMKDGRLIHRGAPEVVTQEAKGLVWECKVESKDAERYIEQYNVGNLKNVGDKTTLRIISDTCPCEGAVEAEPTLEDLYLYYFSEEGKRI
ncbi:MAG: ABC transporter ATP-binding protein [Lachnospiraceae bacterium]|jgi:ABC-2 type transport system ATP-binding protein|nr:ABC transporter ATP-binding protein [Lachnospiraceae bacterium]MCI9250913.1 ABC transporter ATP-binding protein [Lachnospiraceae bacterium]MCI9383601.1 ABC transporter ATP-binding protein [Lachnospiraceae bacterium]MCI9623285.1 ABC transporter ATP-binding protein [Lachnospiraceae bacterium]